MINSFKEKAHRCQIDCTNHDEVIHNLELKSKDLYLFWRNYEWLYNRYYSEENRIKYHDSNQHHQYQIKIQQLEEKIAKLGSEKRKLEIENQLLQRQKTSTVKESMNDDYQKQRKRLKIKCDQYESIQIQMQNEKKKLKDKLRQKDDEYIQQINQLKRMIERKNEQNIDLQKKIDSMRQNSNQINQPYGRRQNKYTQERKIDQRILNNHKEQVRRIIDEEIEAIRSNVIRQTANLITSISEQRLLTLIQVIQEQ